VANMGAGKQSLLCSPAWCPRCFMMMRAWLAAAWLVLAGKALAGESATASATLTLGHVTGVTLTAEGSGYLAEPTVVLSGGGGSGATAKAYLKADKVAVVVVLTAGIGYTSPPKVSIEPPPRIVTDQPADPPNGPTGFVWVPPGTFVMGSQDDDDGKARDRAAHGVTLTQGFWISNHEVTQGEYEGVMGHNYSRFKGDTNRPVERVTWNLAVEYCQKLTERERATGRLLAQQAYRLPTEAEWEYVARAGTTGPRYGELDEIAWHSGNSGNETHPVKQKAPNAWGLYDMIGNVQEWCSDNKEPYPATAQTDPKGPASADYKVVRGGGWRESDLYCRSARRHGAPPVDPDVDRGFRVVLSAVR